MKKTMRKLIPAIAMLLISAAFAGTSTFAWFSMNNKVTVTGMEVTTRVSNNILIAETTTAATAKEAESKFVTNYVKHTESLLEPVSTINGVNYFYNNTQNVAADGDAIADSYVAYPADPSVANALDDFNTNYGISPKVAVGYVDYAFQLKAVNTSTTSPYYVNMTSLDLLYKGAATSQKAFRVAMFVNDMGADGLTAASAPTSGTLKTILRPASADNFTSYAFNIKDDAAGTSESSGYYTYIDGKVYGNAATADEVTAWNSAAAGAGDDITGSVLVSSNATEEYYWYNVNNADNENTSSGTTFEYIASQLYGNNANALSATAWSTVNDGTGVVTNYTTVSHNATARSEKSRPYAVTSTSTLAEVSKFDQAANIGVVAAGATRYFKVVVRLWLEGEDTTCNNDTFATLTKSWSLDLAVEFESAADYHPVININNGNDENTADLSGAITFADAANDKLIDGVTYHKINTIQLNSKDLYTTAEDAAHFYNDSLVYTIDANNHVTDVTNQCTMPAIYEVTITASASTNPVTAGTGTFLKKATQTITGLTGMTSANHKLVVTSGEGNVTASITADGTITITAISGNVTIDIQDLT
ncbi:MAG: hypothetical protein J5762_02560 [Clostridia bacterium]|nr:hypothetical protein [Clostridia bacterium]